MKLSVLIPMHNASKYIERCLNSIYHQGLNEIDFEIVIIDDGSTDNSVELVEQFRASHSNIRLYCEKNKGAYITRNKLLQLARGTYIYCLDADDYLEYNNLDKLLDFAMSDRLDLMCFDTEVTETEDLFLTDNQIPEGFKPSICEGQDFMRDNPYHRIEIWWYLIRRDFLTEQGLEFDDNQYNADVVFTLKLLLSASRLGYAPFSVHRYYQSSDSLMRSKDPYKRKRLIVAIYNMVKDLNRYLEGLANTQNELSEDIKILLHKRRDQFSFFFLTKLSNAGCSTLSLRRRINELKQLNVYPIPTYIGTENSPKYRLLNYVINNERILYPLVRLNYLVKKLSP